MGSDSVSLMPNQYLIYRKSQDVGETGEFVQLISNQMKKQSMSKGKFDMGKILVENKENELYETRNHQMKVISQSVLKSEMGKRHSSLVMKEYVGETPRIPTVSPAQEKELTPLESLRLKDEKSENEPMLPNKGSIENF